MRLQSLLTLVDGTLLNKPAITSFENISFSASKVKRGDLYVSVSGNFFDEALHNGAYIILFDSDITVTDEEVAWVKVNSLNDALIKLIRYNMSEKNIKAFKIDKKEASLLNSFPTDNRLFYLNSSIKKNAENLYKLDSNSIVVSTDENYLKRLFTQIQTVPKNKTPLKLISSGIFSISFIYQNVYYDKVQLSSFFTLSLQALVTLFEENQINFSLKQLGSSFCYQVQFVDRFLNQREFGKSEQALIFEQDASLAEEIFIYFKKNAPWAHVLGVFPYKLELPNSLNYNKIDEISKILLNEHYEYAIIAGENKSLLEHNSFNLKHKQPSLL